MLFLNKKYYTKICNILQLGNHVVLCNLKKRRKHFWSKGHNWGNSSLCLQSFLSFLELQLVIVQLPVSQLVEPLVSWLLSYINLKELFKMLLVFDSISNFSKWDFITSIPALFVTSYRINHIKRYRIIVGPELSFVEPRV